MVRASESSPATKSAGSQREEVSHGARFLQAGNVPHSLQEIEPAALAGAFTLLLVLPIYLLTLPSDLTWAFNSADGAELITAAVTLGIPHPPGYPLYVLLGKLFSLIPLGTVASRFNLLSALSMAGAAAFTAAAASRWVARTGPHRESIPTPDHPFWAALAAGLTFAFLPLIWQQAVVAEVYALNLLLLGALLYSLLDQRAERREWLNGLLMGLAVTSHLTSLFMLPLLLFWGRRQRWHRLLLGFSFGLSPFLLLPLLALGNSPVVWSDPTSVEGWWWLVSAQIYRPNVFGLDPAGWLTRLAQWIREPSFLYFLAVIALLISSKRPYTGQGKQLRLMVLVCAAVYGLYAFSYDSIDASVFLLPGLLLVSILFAGLARHWAHYALLLPLALLVLNFNAVNMHAQTPVRTTIEAVMHDIPANALLITTGDRATFSLWYLKHVEGDWPDVIIVDGNLFAFDWYRQRLARTYTGLERLEKDDLVAFQAGNAKRHPWCSFDIATGMPPERSVTCFEE